MGYYLRYISTDPREISLPLLAAALQQVDSAYTIEAMQTKAHSESGTLKYRADGYGEIEVNHSGGTFFVQELEELAEMLEETSGPGKPRVQQTLRNARAIIAVRALFQGREVEPTRLRIDPLWQWLHDNRTGLLQVDGEGYYDRTGLILEE